MKKILYIAIAGLILACSPDPYEFELETYTFVPESLEIAAPVGIKLESKFADSSARMNVKLDTSGNYYIKIRDIQGKVVAKELVKGKVGDNLFTVYTSTLPKSSYKLELYLENEKVGFTTINLY